METLKSGDIKIFLGMSWITFNLIFLLENILIMLLTFSLEKKILDNISTLK